MIQNIADLREDYRLKSLDFADVTPHPFSQFETSFKRETFLTVTHNHYFFVVVLLFVLKQGLIMFWHDNCVK